MRPLIVLLAATGVSLPAHASLPSVRVGAITSEKSCSLYELTAGTHREGAFATRNAVGSASETSWRSYLVRDCVDNFASLRTSLEAALAASGKLSVVPGRAGGSYVVSGRISEVGSSAQTVSSDANAGPGFAVGSAGMFVNMDVTVHDPARRIVFGGLLTKRIETGSGIQTGGLSTSSSQSGQAVYSELQHQVALAVARIVAFKIDPLRVVQANGQRIQLNYGAPLLQLGTMVQVTAPDGAVARYNVSAAGEGSAQADYYGGADASRIVPGSVGIAIEADDPAANARRFEKTDLP